MNPRTPATIFCLLFLSACVTAETSNVGTSSSSQTRSEIPAAITAFVEPYPLEPTVEHFANMTLSGSNLVIGKILEQNDIYARHFITYRSNGVLVSGIMNIPKGTGVFPLIVLNHGYIDPTVYTNGRGLRREQDALARAGFAVLHTDYRKHAQSDPDPDTTGIYDNALAYALDSANAVLAVRAAKLPNIDASKVGMLGHSMGGGVTQHVIVAHPDLIDAAILYAPISSHAWNNFDRWRREEPEALPTLTTLKSWEENPAPWDAMSQQFHLDNIAVPVLIFHGKGDKDVPIEWSNDLSNRLEGLGKDVAFVIYPKDGHEFSTTWRHFIDTSIEFFRKNLQ